MQLTPINKHFNACDQKWDDMSQQGNGRHCQQCDRVLVDLTDKTEQQVMELFHQHNYQMCGLYTLGQMHRLDDHLTRQEQFHKQFSTIVVKLALGLSLTAVPAIAAAQSTTNSADDTLLDSMCLEKEMFLDMDTLTDVVSVSSDTAIYEAMERIPGPVIVDYVPPKEDPYLNAINPDMWFEIIR